jgi:hypothetical protein
MESFEILRDVKNGLSYLTKLVGADGNARVVLPADTQVSLTIPTAAIQGAVIFYPENGRDFYVSPSAIGALPANNTFTFDEIYFNLPGIWLTGQTTLYFRAEVEMRLNACFFTRAA